RPVPVRYSGARRQLPIRGGAATAPSPSSQPVENTLGSDSMLSRADVTLPTSSAGLSVTVSHQVPLTCGSTRPPNAMRSAVLQPPIGGGAATAPSPSSKPDENSLGSDSMLSRAEVTLPMSSADLLATVSTQVPLTCVPTSPPKASRSVVLQPPWSERLMPAELV